MTQREISLKKDETLLVKWIAEPFRYARLVRVISSGDPDPSAFIFDIHPVELSADGVTLYPQIKVRFYALYCVVTVGKGGDEGISHVVYKDTWGQQTVKQLLVSVVAGFPGGSGGYEIVDWGGFAVSDDRPANQVY
ncbi:hypothetical protein ACIBCN_42440 [Nocardia sp. NPDC051052]|uniref:hypothetical protein n=1 Tax=Nocardia sp. NPDC051052 TaxID=3364322 RepID=UPI00379E63A2